MHGSDPVVYTVPTTRIDDNLHMGFFGELKRRNVVRVGIAYVVASWLLAQVADLVLDVIGAPDVVLRTVVALLALGFIPAVLFAWAFEITPEGIKKEADVVRDDSITQVTGKKLNYVTILLLLAVIAMFVVDRMIPRDSAEATGQSLALPGSNSPAPVPVTKDNATEMGPSIAVVPFANRSNQADDLFFTDGIHDDLLTQLAKIHDLKVISRTSVMDYRDTTKNMRQIGEELGVKTILEGGVQKVGNRVRINVQLIEADGDHHLWAETYDRELTAENIFDLQSEITREIVNAISIELTPEEQVALKETPTQNLKAYEAFLQARELFKSANYSREEEMAAKPLLEHAIELDPNYVEAISMLSQIYGQMYWRGLDTSPAMLETYRATLQRAFDVNPNSPAALRASANYDYRVNNDYRASRDKLERALESLPGNADLHGDLGLTQRRLGLWEESVASFERALALDPANSFYRSLKAETLDAFFQWERIIAEFEPLEDADRDELDLQLTRARAQFCLSGDLDPLTRALDTMNLSSTTSYGFLGLMHVKYRRDWPKVLDMLDSDLWQNVGTNAQQFANREYQKGLAWAAMGDAEKAEQHYRKSVTYLDEILASSRQPRAYGGMTVAKSLARLGEYAQALELGQMVVSENAYERDAMLHSDMLGQQAMVIGLAGDRDGSLETLKTALDTPSGLGWCQWDLHYSPDWDFFRDDPRFQKLASPPIVVGNS